MCNEDTITFINRTNSCPCFSFITIVVNIPMSLKYYGTLKSELERIWQQKKTPLLDVDVKGGINVQQLYPYNSLSLFIEVHIN